MDRRLEERLQDYLDGRMSADERARFEESLARDAELAELVRADVETRNALRGGEEELPPGFYTRARARFEDTAQPGGRRWFRMLSWETAGLTAAVLLAGVLFVPMMFRDDLRRQTLTAKPETATETMKKESVASFADGEEDGFNAAPAERPVEQTLDALGYAGGADKDEAAADIAPEPKRKRQAPPHAPPQVAADAAELERAPSPPELEERADEQRYAPAPPATRRQAEKRDGLSQPMKSAGEGGKGDQPVSVTTLHLDQVQGIPLPAGVVDPGGVRRIESEDAWRLLRREAGEGLADLGPFDPHWRLVLIGPRAVPFDCRWIEVRQSGGNYWIKLSPPGEDPVEAPHGCGVPLPRDGRGVVVEPFPPAE